MDEKESAKSDLKNHLYKINQDIYTWKHILKVNDLEISEFMFKKKWHWFKSRICSLYLTLPFCLQGDESRSYFLTKQSAHCQVCARMNDSIAERKRWALQYHKNINEAMTHANDLAFAIKNI